MKEVALALIINHENNKILGVSRKDNPLDFGLPGGKKEDNETLIECLKREVFEETGLTITFHEKIFRENDGIFLCTTFLCEVSGIIKTFEEGIVKEITWKEAETGAFGVYNRKLHHYIKNNE